MPKAQECFAHDRKRARDHLQGFQPGFLPPGLQRRGGQHDDPVADPCSGGTTRLIDGGQQGPCPRAADIYGSAHGPTLKQCLPGHDEIGERAGHDQAAVIASRVEENNAV